MWLCTETHTEDCDDATRGSSARSGIYTNGVLGAHMEEHEQAERTLQKEGKATANAHLT